MDLVRTGDADEQPDEDSEELCEVAGLSSRRLHNSRSLRDSGPSLQVATNESVKKYSILDILDISDIVDILDILDTIETVIDSSYQYRHA